MPRYSDGETIGCKFVFAPRINSDDDIRNGTFVPPYGSADDFKQVYDQIKPRLKELKEKEGRLFFIEINILHKKAHPGWRWHKNGAYIGTNPPQHEHLGDEDREFIVTFVVHEIIMEE